MVKFNKTFLLNLLPLFYYTVKTRFISFEKRRKEIAGPDEFTKRQVGTISFEQ